MERITQGQAAAKWRELAEKAAQLAQFLDVEGAFDTPSGCAMAGDDKHLSEYQLTTAVQMCLIAAIDHLHTVTALVVEHHFLSMAAPASLARGVLENGAAAFWLLNPPARNERLMRTLMWWAANAKDQESATGELAAEAAKYSGVLTRLEGLAEARGLDKRKIRNRYRSSETLRYADANARSKDGVLIGVLLPWQLASGLAHGRPWAYWAALKSETLSSNGEILRMRHTKELDRALYPTLKGYLLVEAVLRVHQRRTRR